MKKFEVYKTDSGWGINVSGGFSFSDLTYNTMLELTIFLSNLGYEEF